MLLPVSPYPVAHETRQLIDFCGVTRHNTCMVYVIDWWGMWYQLVMVGEVVVRKWGEAGELWVGEKVGEGGGTARRSGIRRERWRRWNSECLTTWHSLEILLVDDSWCVSRRHYCWRYCQHYYINKLSDKTSRKWKITHQNLRMLYHSNLFQEEHVV